MLHKFCYLFLGQFLQNIFRSVYWWHSTESFHKKLILFLFLCSSTEEQFHWQTQGNKLIIRVLHIFSPIKLASQIRQRGEQQCFYALVGCFLFYCLKTLLKKLQNLAKVVRVGKWGIYRDRIKQSFERGHWSLGFS